MKPMFPKDDFIVFFLLDATISIMEIIEPCGSVCPEMAFENNTKGDKMITG